MTPGVRFTSAALDIRIKLNVEARRLASVHWMNARDHFCKGAPNATFAQKIFILGSLLNDLLWVNSALIWR